MSAARLFDLIALSIVTVVLLLPQPSITAHPAAKGPRADLLQLAAMQDAHYQKPDDEATAILLSRAYLTVDQPGWAIGTLSPFLEKGPSSYEVHQVAAYAYGDLLRPKDALAQAEAGLALCDKKGDGCRAPSRVKLQYIQGVMSRLVEKGVDPKTDPLTAKQLTSEGTHATKAPLQLAPPPPPAPAPLGDKKPIPPAQKP